MCEPGKRKSSWTVDTNNNIKEYPGIVPGVTQMTLASRGTADIHHEWKIEFATPKSEPKHHPPAVDVLHLVYVKRTAGGTNGSIGGSKYFQEAARVITEFDDYLIGVGHVDKVPTLLVVVLSDGAKPRSFDLVLVKLEEARAPMVTQGGVIHGHEN